MKHFDLVKIIGAPGFTSFTSFVTKQRFKYHQTESPANHQPAVFLQVPRTQTKLSTMLQKLGLKYEGRPHSGLDDSRNIARIAIRMLRDGCQLRVNERMHAGQLLSVPSSAPVEGAPPPHSPRSRD